MAFMDDIRVAYSGAGKVQAAANDPQPQADLDVSFRATEINPFRVVRTERRLMNCQNSALQRKKTTTARGELGLRYYGAPQVIAAFLAYIFGTDTPTGTDPITHAITRATSREMRLFSLRVGADDGADPGKILFNCSVASMAIRASAGPDAMVECDMTIVHHPVGDDASGTTWPACFDEDPSLLSDGDLVVGGVSKKALLQGFQYLIDPQIAMSTDPYVNSIYPQRWRRAKETLHQLTYQLSGFEDDTDWDNGVANDFVGTSTSVVLSIGAAGNRVSVTFPVAYVGLAGNQIGAFGELGETTLNAVVDPRDIDGDANAVAVVSAVIPAADQAAAFLVASS
jgi:hypothetical protein